MKHTERQHLKENELAHSLASASHLLGRRKSTIVTTSVVVGVVLVGAIGYAVITQQSAAARAE